MIWLIAAAALIGAIVVALAVLVYRQGCREGGTVEMPGGETIFGAPPQPEQRREFAE
jgi:hypothetical protein